MHDVFGQLAALAEADPHEIAFRLRVGGFLAGAAMHLVERSWIVYARRGKAIRVQLRSLDGVSSAWFDLHPDHRLWCGRGIAQAMAALFGARVILEVSEWRQTFLAGDPAHHESQRKAG